MADFAIKQNMTAPTMVAQLSRDDVPVDLALASTVTFRLSHQKRSLEFSHVMVVDTASTGHVSYGFDSAGDTAVSGIYDADIVVSWTGSESEAFPSGGHFLVAIVP